MPQIKKYMEENFSEKITLDDLANLTGYNRTYISTLFKRIVGIKFYDYLTQIRLMYALYDIHNPDLTLTDIALQNGFPDLKNFNSKFREVFHVSPSQYRRLEALRNGPYFNKTRHYYSTEDPSVRNAVEACTIQV